MAPLGGWGTLRYSANAAFMMTIIAKQSTDSGVKSSALDFAKTQVGYFAGSSGRSFIVGYGTNPPAQPHHRAASCPDRPAPCGQAQFSAAGGSRVGRVSGDSPAGTALHGAQRGSPGPALCPQAPTPRCSTGRSSAAPPAPTTPTRTRAATSRPMRLHWIITLGLPARSRGSSRLRPRPPRRRLGRGSGPLPRKLLWPSQPPQSTLL